MGSESLYNNIKTWEFMPPRTILSSATMCDLDNIEYMITEHLEKYPNIYVGTVGSQEIHIGCDVMTYERERVLPHAGCTTSAGTSFTVYPLPNTSLVIHDQIYLNTIACYKPSIWPTES